MKDAIISSLAQWLAAGGTRIGEIAIDRDGTQFVLRHHADHCGKVEIFTNPGDARLISQYDGEGEYRPLKSAPNLRRGWLLRLPDVFALRAALDFFYPAMIGSWVAYQHGDLRSVDLRATAERQSGMYAVVKKISNAQADALAGDFCKSDGKCLKTILWKLDAATPVSCLPPQKFDPQADQLGAKGTSMPMLCAEACNLFVAAARGVVKGEAA